MSEIPKTAVMIAHYEPVTRIGLKAIIESHPQLRVCGEAETAPAARCQCEELQPVVVLLALMPAVGWGFAVLRELRQLVPAGKFVIFSESDDALSVQRAFEAGARSYVSRRCAATEVTAAILHALDGGLYVAPRVGHLLLKSVASGAMAMRDKTEATLSARELEVFRMIGAGRSTRDVAEDLGVSIKTIETHVGRVKSKLGVMSIHELRVTAAGGLGADGTKVSPV